jgi:hypothetical protein
VRPWRTPCCGIHRHLHRRAGASNPTASSAILQRVPAGEPLVRGPDGDHQRIRRIHLLRRIGLYAATAITVGNIVGSGIFRSPHSVAQHLSGFGVVLFAWVLGGVLSISGSLVLAELAVTHPRTGGLYVFIREAFGDTLGFVFGWANLWVIKPTVIASITSVFALYFCQVLHLGKSLEFPVGAAAILLLTFINTLGVREGAGTQSLFTTLKVIGIAGLCVAAFTLPAGTAVEAVPAAPHTDTSFLQALALAMISILFAYDGWTDSTYVGGEIVEPRRTLPIAIVGGTWLVIAIYVLTNIAYYHVLGADGVAHYEAVGSETLRRLLGEPGARALAVLVAISTLKPPAGDLDRPAARRWPRRALWKPLAACTRDAPLPRWRLDSRSSVVRVALVRGGFEDVSGWFVTTSWLFWVTNAAVFVYRRHRRQGRIAAPVYRAALFP